MLLTMEVRNQAEDKRLDFKEWRITLNQFKRIKLPHIQGEIRYQLQKTGKVILNFPDNTQLIYTWGDQ